MIKRRYFIHAETRSKSTGEALRQCRLFTHTSWLPDADGALEYIKKELEEYIADNHRNTLNPDDMVVISFNRCQ